MKILILLNEQYPDGMAATNRTHLYARGLTEMGNDVVILIPRATERPGKIRNIRGSGINDGVRFKYAHEPIIRKSFLGRRIQNIVSFIKTTSFFFSFRPDIILVVTNTLKYNLVAKLCSIVIRASVVREKTEVPYYRFEELSVNQIVRIKNEFRLFDGLMVISSSLREFFINEMKLKIRIREIPILIDSRQHLSPAISPSKKDTLVYAGSLLDHKDGILIIIKAFARVLENHPGINLILTGDIEGSPDKDDILALIRELDIKEKVELTGYVSSQRLREILSSAVALLLAKPDNRQNRYNMATKIGEYLLTGRPAVISSVDPACHYLTHRKNVFIVEPDEKKIAAEIEFILANPGEAGMIGKAGKVSALELFDYVKHSKEIDEFFRLLKGYSTVTERVTGKPFSSGIVEKSNQ